MSSMILFKLHTLCQNNIANNYHNFHDQRSKVKVEVTKTSKTHFWQ